MNDCERSTIAVAKDLVKTAKKVYINSFDNRPVLVTKKEAMRFLNATCSTKWVFVLVSWNGDFVTIDHTGDME